MGKISLTRDSGYADSIRRYLLECDGPIIGDIRQGETREFNIPDGIHKIRLKIDWASSNTLDLELSNNDVIELDCGSNLRGWRVVILFFYSMIMPSKYLWIKVRKKDAV